MGVDDEFSMLAGNAADAGLPWAGRPPVRRVDTKAGAGPRISAIRWGEDQPRAVLLHGGGQNAHTWDAVALALGFSLLAVDLPGHGHSGRRADRDYGPWATAEAVAPAVRQWAPYAGVVVGVSLGGLTALRLTVMAPDVVRRLVLVDVTPSVLRRRPAMARQHRGTTVLLDDERVFATREEMIERAALAAPDRPRGAVERGVIHNTRQRQDGRWEWRYDRIVVTGDYAPLWEDVSGVAVPLTLVRGGDSVFVPDEDVAELNRRQPGAQVHDVPGAGHAVQSDQPVALAGIIRSALSLPRGGAAR
jgi:pimeloyl-ACP methyl ester carboxylesterase